MSYNTKNYEEQGGDKWVIGAGGELEVAGEIDVTGDLKIDSVTVDATSEELNLLDLSAQTETILVAGAISLTKRVTKLSGASGTYAVTLAVPDATMLGQVKIIEMSEASNAITLALTNVQGQSAGTGATFNALNEVIVLVAGISKWTVIGEAGVTLA